jgi:hypothetical protein
MPPHSDDQLGMYTNLAYAVPGLKRSDIPRFYKDATFGVKPGNLESTESPRDDVTIVRDNFGVPHIYGKTRPGAMFGTGYATAEDRLFFMDVLRHAGRAELSSFAGGSNAGMDESVWADTPYREADLRVQYDCAPSVYGRRGVLIQHDVQNYVAGINRFIAEACVNQMRLPGEYDLIAPDQSICLRGTSGPSTTSSPRRRSWPASSARVAEASWTTRSRSKRPRSASASAREGRSSRTSRRSTIPRRPRPCTGRASPTVNRPSAPAE